MKVHVNRQLDKLLALKKEYKELTGEDYAAPSQAKPEKKKKEAAEVSGWVGSGVFEFREGREAELGSKRCCVNEQKPPEEKKEGPSKSELKKLERKEKRKAGKGE